MLVTAYRGRIDVFCAHDLIEFDRHLQQNSAVD